MNLSSLLVLALLVVGVALAVQSIRKGGASCSGSCDGRCSSCHITCQERNNIQ